MNANRSAVVVTLEQASLASWKKWRKHVEAGTGESPEALAAFDESRFAGSTWLGEVADRAVATERAAARAA